MIRLVLIIIISTALISQLRADGHAFLISIGNYQDENISRLSSTNDAVHIKEALLANGFTTDGIIHLNDQDASKKQIIHTFYNILIPRLQRGDHVYFHFSGHGQQIYDSNGDEFDTYDESILAYDAKPKYVEGGYQGEKHIRDDELEEVFNRIREELGDQGQLIVVFDSCHSGTMPRGNTGIARGILTPFQPTGYQSPTIETSGEFFVECDTIGTKTLAPIISIAASSPYELNRETIDYQGNGIGSLSYAIFNALGKQLTDFIDLFQEIRFSMMKLNQTPAIEGDLALTVFGNQAKAVNNEFRVSSIDKNVITVDGGQLQGVHVGSIVSFVNSKGEELCRDTIIEASLTSATLFTNRQFDSAELYRSKVVVLKKYYPFKLPISMRLLSATLIELTTQFIEKDNQFFNSDNSAYKIREVKKEIIELYHGTTLLQTFNLKNIDSIDDFFDKMNSIYQLEFIKQLDESNVLYNIAAELKMKNNSKAGHTFRIGDTVELLIQNKGPKSAYFNLIEIYPDSLDYIFSNQNPQDLFMNPGQVKSFEFIIQKPATNMTVKVFSSIEPIYFGDASTRGGLDFFENILNPVSRSKDQHTTHLTYGVSTLEYEIIE